MSFFDALKSPPAQSEVPTVQGLKGPLYVGQAVKVTGGKYNGLRGNIRLLDLTSGGCAGVEIEHEKKFFTNVIECHFLQNLADFEG